MDSWTMSTEADLRFIGMKMAMSASIFKDGFAGFVSLDKHKSSHMLPGLLRALIDFDDITLAIATKNKKIDGKEYQKGITLSGTVVFGTKIKSILNSMGPLKALSKEKLKIEYCNFLTLDTKINYGVGFTFNAEKGSWGLKIYDFKVFLQVKNNMVGDEQDIMIKERLDAIRQNEAAQMSLSEYLKNAQDTYKSVMPIYDPAQTDEEEDSDKDSIKPPYGISMGFETKFRLKFPGNSPLTFKASTKFSPTSATFSFSLHLVGKWHPFGLSWLSVKDVYGEIAFAPDAPVLGIKSIGLSGAIDIGSTKIEVAFRISSDMQDCFLYGKIRKLGLRNLARAIGISGSGLKKVPNIGIDKADVMIAPKDGKMGPYVYQQGFRLRADLSLLGMRWKVMIRSYMDGIVPQAELAFTLFSPLARLNYRRYLRDLFASVLPGPLKKVVKAFDLDLKEIGLSKISLRGLLEDKNPYLHLKVYFAALRYDTTIETKFKVPISYMLKSMNPFYVIYMAMKPYWNIIFRELCKRLPCIPYPDVEMCSLFNTCVLPKPHIKTTCTKMCFPVPKMCKQSLKLWDSDIQDSNYISFAQSLNAAKTHGAKIVLARKGALTEDEKNEVNDYLKNRDENEYLTETDEYEGDEDVNEPKYKDALYYVGCFKDDLPRVLPHNLTHGQTPAGCARYAAKKGFKYVGIQWWTRQCFGGNEHDRLGAGRTINRRSFDMHTCHRDQYGHMLGGGMTNAVCRVLKYRFVGCFKDAHPRAMVHLGRYMSVEKCAKVAEKRGYKYFGRQWSSRECWGGNEKYDRYGKGRIISQRRFTSYTCHRDLHGAMLGGGMTNAVFKIKPSPVCAKYGWIEKKSQCSNVYKYNRLEWHCEHLKDALAKQRCLIQRVGKSSNVALNKRCTSSHLYQNSASKWGCQHALDGDYVYHYPHHKLFHTSKSYSPWFRVDLLGEYKVKYISIWNPHYSHRMRGSYVYGYNRHCTHCWTRRLNHSSSRYYLPMTSHEMALGQNKLRYVKVVGPRGYLNFTEIEVFADNPPLNSRRTLSKRVCKRVDKYQKCEKWIIPIEKTVKVYHKWLKRKEFETKGLVKAAKKQTEAEYSYCMKSKSQSKSIGYSNIARNKRCYSSQLYKNNKNDWGCQHMLDGNVATRPLFHTNRVGNPFVLVDLGDDYYIDKVQIYHRFDCCWDRLKGFNLQLLDRYHRSIYSVHIRHSSKLYNYYPRRTNVRYLRISKWGSGMMNIQEVLALGHPVRGDWCRVRKDWTETKVVTVDGQGIGIERKYEEAKANEKSQINSVWATARAKVSKAKQHFLSETRKLQKQLSKAKAHEEAHKLRSGQEKAKCDKETKKIRKLEQEIDSTNKQKKSMEKKIKDLKKVKKQAALMEKKIKTGANCMKNMCKMKKKCKNKCYKCKPSNKTVEITKKQKYKCPKFVVVNGKAVIKMSFCTKKYTTKKMTTVYKECCKKHCVEYEDCPPKSTCEKKVKAAKEAADFLKSTKVEDNDISDIEFVNDVGEKLRIRESDHELDRDRWGGRIWRVIKRVGSAAVSGVARIGSLAYHGAKKAATVVYRAGIKIVKHAYRLVPKIVAKVVSYTQEYVTRIAKKINDIRKRVQAQALVAGKWTLNAIKNPEHSFNTMKKYVTKGITVAYKNVKKYSVVAAKWTAEKVKAGAIALKKANLLDKMKRGLIIVAKQMNQWRKSLQVILKKGMKIALNFLKDPYMYYPCGGKIVCSKVCVPYITGVSCAKRATIKVPCMKKWKWKKKCLC